MRRIAVVGDRLMPDGGQVLDYPCSATLNGHHPALIGGQAYCAKCKNVGLIAKAGGPRRMQYTNEVALDGDVVLCMCPSPPRIAAGMAGAAWFEDGGSEAGLVHVSGVDPGRSQYHYDELLIAMASGVPVADYPYFVETSDKRHLFGYTDKHGCLPRIATICAGSLTVYWGDEALARRQGGENA